MYFGDGTSMARVSALAIVTASSLQHGIVIGYLDGSADAIRHLALALRRQTAKQGCPRIEARLPDIPSIRDTLISTGYAPYPDEPFLVFELGLK